MDFQIDFLFRVGAGYDQLIERMRLVQKSPHSVFTISNEAKVDKRFKKAKEIGWVEISHKRYNGVIKLLKSLGVCRGFVDEQADGKFIGAWVSWLARNATDLMSGFDIRVMDPTDHSS
jgi:hypothetical protein